MKKIIVITLSLGLFATLFLAKMHKELSTIVFEINDQKMDNLHQSTVIVYTDHKSRGSGFLLKDSRGDGYSVVTNAHVCVVQELDEDRKMDPANLSVMKRMVVKNDFVDFTAAISEIDLENDLCILNIYEDYKGPALEIARDPVKMFDIVYLATHNPSSNRFLIKGGYVLDIEQQGTELHHNSFVMNMGALPGMSGSPIVDMRGRVVGVLWGMSPPYKVISFAVQSEALKELVKLHEAKKLPIFR